MTSVLVTRYWLTEWKVPFFRNIASPFQLVKINGIVRDTWPSISRVQIRIFRSGVWTDRMNLRRPQCESIMTKKFSWFNIRMRTLRRRSSKIYNSVYFTQSCNSQIFRFAIISFFCKKWLSNNIDFMSIAPFSFHRPCFFFVFPESLTEPSHAVFISWHVVEKITTD